MIKKGICRNIDGCSLAENKEVQEVDSENFVCKECGRPLSEFSNKKAGLNPQQKKKIKLIVILIVALLVIAGIVIAIVAISSNAAEKEALEQEQAREQARLDSIAKAEADSIEAIRFAEEQARMDSIAELERMLMEQARQDSIEAAKKQKTKNSAPATSGSIDYGKWSGSWKSGKPNGTGTMRYSKEHLIDSRDPQKRVAQKGDYIIGEFYEGKLIQGVWYDASNTVKGSIIIGM